MIKVYFYFMDDEAVLTSNVFQNDKKKPGDVIIKLVSLCYVK